MHPELYLVVHQQRERELEHRLAVDLAARGRTTPTPVRRLDLSAVGHELVAAARALLRGAQARSARAADACCETVCCAAA